MWIELCLNPYENKVQENENGKRRVQISGGWLEEDNVEAIKVCRVSSAYDVEIAANSMSVPAISKSFNHDPAMAYAIWSAKRNIKTDVSPTLLLSEDFLNNKSYRSFKRKVGMSLGKKAITVWAGNTGWSNNVARWDVVIKAPSPTLTRGAQIGLARGIQRFSGKWIEMGLLDSIDSSTWRLPAKNRMVWAAEYNNHPLAPQSYNMQSWLMPPVAKTITKKNTFNPLGKESKEKPKSSKVLADGKELWNTDDGINRVLWCTASSLHRFGADGLNVWWEWFARVGKGVVVFDKTDTAEQRALFALLKKENKNYQRWMIQDELQNTKFVVWWIGLFKDKIASKTVLLSDWVGEAPKKRQNESLNEEDEFGRVRYRALSKLNKSEGMAPKRLEQSMNKALVELSHTKKDVDAVISNLLNIDRKFLPDSLSAEQVDAISLAISAFEKNAGMILADETGFGKGRILAALAIIGLKLGKTVLFFTEKSQLFTDFFRDITDVVNLDKVDIMPTVLHGSAKVYDQQGNVIKKALSKTNFDKMLNTPEWEEKEDKLILSTYSQINRPGKGNAKIKWLVDRVKDGECWLLLDEAHNAAGDSNISENLNTLLTYTEGVLYSSATFAKSEQNLSLYKKALAVEEWLYGLIESTMISDDGALREALTTSMASRGSFIRREHPPVPPPKPVWIDMTDERREAYRNFSMMWRCIHEATQKWEVAMGNHSSAAWMKVGSVLSRSVKEFSLLMKCDSLIQEVEDIVNSDKKAVIVVQSTFESALKSLLGEMDDDEEEEDVIDLESGEENSKKKKKSIPTNVELDHIPLWTERMVSILNQAAPQDDLLSMGVDDEQVDAAMQAYARALESISKMPGWDLMPFERIKNALKAKGIEVGELSGRTLTVSQTPNGKWIIHSRKVEPRTETVRRFNNGELNVIIVTLAGCSGISLHAGKKFKDQRQRVLIEADIAPNPANRIQFWGRVRRKDQVCEPLYMSLMFYMPAEIRIMSKEDSKREKLAAHVGMKQERKEVGWITEEGETIVAEWALERPEAAKFIGVAYPVLDNPTGRVDKALARLIVMEDYEQEALLSRLERGLKLAEDVSFKDKSSANIKQSRIVRRGWLWGHPERSEDSERGEKGPLAMPRIDYVERVIEKNVQPNYDDITETLKLRKKDADFAYYEGLSVLDRWSDSWAEEAKAGVPTTAYRRSVWDWVSRVLPSSLCGNAVRVSRPGTGEPVWGMILGVYAPEKGGRIKGASPWALSQVGLEVWLIGESEPLIISLARCYSDANFMVNGEKAVASWFKAEVVSHTCITIEGNPLLSAAWGKKWGAGRPTLINDDEKGVSWVWMLPGSWTWDVMKTLPKDLIDVDHTMKFLYDNPGAPIYAAVRTGKLFKLIPKEGAVILQMDREMDNFSKETWINFKNKQSMKNEVWRNGVVERTIDWKSIIYILYAIDKAGIKWRVDAEYGEWYYRTSKQVMEGIIKTKSKALTGAAKKQFSNKQKSFSK